MSRDNPVVIEAAMIKKYGGTAALGISDGCGYVDYTESLAALQPLIENHPNWSMRRMDGHRWEVRNGLKDKTYYGKTLAIAICKALLELP